MKHIVKQAEPAAFSQWKALASPDWQPTYAKLSGEPKTKLKRALMAEQGYLCCYCERRLTDDDAHIEHFRPQSDPAVDPLDFGNLLCSCQSQIQRGEPRHCGNLKESWFDNTLLISPMDSGCERRFKFTGDGRINKAVDSDNAAETTIARLGLDIPKLNALRSKTLEPFLDESLSLEELQDFVGGYLRRDSAGRFGEFWTMIDYLFSAQP